MNTKEAKVKELILFMEHSKLRYDDLYPAEIDEIISLLQQGEKYRQMWKELYLNKIRWNDYSTTVYMQELEKNTSPKGR